MQRGMEMKTTPIIHKRHVQAKQVQWGWGETKEGGKEEDVPEERRGKLVESI